MQHYLERVSLSIFVTFLLYVSFVLLYISFEDNLMCYAELYVLYF
jgi:hypothetical protein